METLDQVSASDKSVSENEGIEMQIRNSSDTLSSVRNDSGFVTENLEEIKHASDEVACMPTNDKDKDISSTVTSNVIEESNSEAARGESRNVSVEKEESLCLLTGSSNMSANKEKSDAIPVKVGEISQKKDISQPISQALTGGERFEITSIESSFSTSFFIDKALSRTNRLASCDSLSQQSSVGGNVLKCTRKANQTLNLDTAGEVSRVESLRSLCLMQKDSECGDLQVDADSISEKKETNGNGKSISPDEQQTSTKASETVETNESVTSKNSADYVETPVLQNTNNNGAADATEISSEGNVMNEQSSIPTKTACEEHITCENSGAATKNATDEDVADKHSPQTVGGSVSKEHSNIAAKIEVLHHKRDENVSNEQSFTAKTAICETVSNETADVGTPEAEAQSGETEDDSERRAFFYMSSCSVPGMGDGWEWPTVSSEYHHQRIPRRRERRITSESRNCLGSQRCHYIILAVGVLGAILGCLTYHLQDFGIGPKVLRPIGASAAFLSFVVCAFSSVYLTYLSYYTQARSPLDVHDPVASMLIDTMPQSYNSDPRFYFTSSAAATSQQVFRETQSADSLDKRGYSWNQSDIKRPFGVPGPSGYDPDSKRFKMDPTTMEGQVYEMKSIRRISEKDRCKERNPSQASDSSHYTLADQAFQSHSSGESENGEKIPLLPKK